MSFGGYAADVLPLLGAWLLVAWLTRRFVPTWLVGVTLGVLARMVILNHYRWNQLSFLAVTLVFVGAVAGIVFHFCNPSRGRGLGSGRHAER